MSVKVGLGRADLTPPLGTSLAGYFEDRHSTGVHDPLLCKSLYLGADGGYLRVTACDLIAMDSPTVRSAEEQAGAAIGPEAQSLVCCTHTHLGPAVVSVFSPPRAQDYAAGLPQLVAQAMRAAASAPHEAELAIGVSEAHGIAFNRRYHMRDGSVRMNPGTGNPDIVKPAGPIDPQVLVLVARGASGRPRALLVNFALHLDTIGGDVVSADYPAFLAANVREALGEDVETVFANGAFGDINHINVSDRNQPRGFAMPEHIGRVLADAVLRAYESAQPVPKLAVRAARKVVPLPAREIREDMLEQGRLVQLVTDPNADPAERRQAAERLGTDAPDIRARTYAKEWQLLAARNGRPFDADVRVACLGPEVALVGLPSETFCELGLAIKRNSPFAHTFVISLANGYVGYVATARGYAEGSYETTPARSSPVAPGSGEMMADAAVALLDEVRAALG